MFNRAIATMIFFLTSVYFSHTYAACQETGCSGTVYGPVQMAGVTELDGNMYIVAMVENTATTGAPLPSGSTDDTCNYTDANWLLARPLATADNAANTTHAQAILDVLSAGQAASSQQTMFLDYAWDVNLGACVITSAGYMN